jgi:peptidoglycan/LPS O-acetylase OafA/YrhL
MGDVLFIGNWLSGFHQYNPNFASFHLWSISIEEQYYLILPFLIPWLSKQKKKTVSFFFFNIFLVLLMCRYPAIQANAEHPFIYVLPISGDSFLAGIILGLGTYDHVLKKINSLLSFSSGIAILVLLYALPDRKMIDLNQLFMYALTAIAFSFILISVLFSKNRMLLFLFSAT